MATDSVTIYFDKSAVELATADYRKTVELLIAAIDRHMPDPSVRREAGFHLNQVYQHLQQATELYVRQTCKDAIRFQVT